MRIAFIIVGLAAIAVALVQIRAEENHVRNEMLTVRNYVDIEVPRQLWAQDVEIARLSSFKEVGKRADSMALDLIERDKKDRLARGEDVETPSHDSHSRAAHPTTPTPRH